MIDGQLVAVISGGACRDGLAEIVGYDQIDGWTVVGNHAIAQSRIEFMAILLILRDVRNRATKKGLREAPRRKRI